MKSHKLIKKSIHKNQRAKFKISADIFVFTKKIKNNLIAYYLLLTNSTPRKLQPYYHTFVYSFIRLAAVMIINIKYAFLYKKQKILKIMKRWLINKIKNLKKIILTLKKNKGHSLTDYFAPPKFSRKLLFRVFAFILIVSLISAQSLAVSGFEAHLVNVTAKIINDIPEIEPNGGEFCNIAGATITLSTTYTATSTIIYTTDGSDPVCPSTGDVYTAPFTLYQSATVKARTCHDEKQSAIASRYFEVSAQYCGESSCDAEPIDYWQNNQGCEDDPAVSQLAVQINNLSSGHFQGAFAATTAEAVCSLYDLTGCPAAGTLAGELCRARGETLANLSNIVTGKLDLNAVIAGAYENIPAFNNLSLTASSTIEEALNKVEEVLVNPGATAADLAEAGYVSQRIYTFYNSENPYAEPTCIYYEPGEVVLNEFVPNPSCDAKPVDVILVMDRSGSMSYDSPSRLSQAKTAANSFIDNLQSNDQSALVSYATTATLDKTLSNGHAATKTAIDSLSATGATNIGDAIGQANNELISVRANPLASKVEILLTDGLANKPYGPGYGEFAADVAYSKAKADEAAAGGIKIFTIGLGSNVNEPMLQYIATTTGAQYYFAPSGADLDAIYAQISEQLCSGGDDDSLFGLAGEWVELYNNGSAQKDLADWMIDNSYATTTVKISTANTLATSTIIGASGSGAEWLVVLFNGARLNNLSDTIFLYDDVNHLIDFYSYASSTDSDPFPDPESTPGESNYLDGDLAGQEGKSFARIPDGGGGWVDPIPTPGLPNKLAIDITPSIDIISLDDEAAPDDIEEDKEDQTPNALSDFNKAEIIDMASSTSTPDLSLSSSTPDTLKASSTPYMPFFTSNPEIASSALMLDISSSTSTPDTSLSALAPDIASFDQTIEPDGQSEGNSNSEEPIISENQEINNLAAETNTISNNVDINENNNINNNPTSDQRQEAKIESAPEQTAEPEPIQEQPIIPDMQPEQATEPSQMVGATASPVVQETTL